MKALAKVKNIHAENINSTDLETLRRAANEGMQLYTEHENNIAAKVKIKDFAPVENLDFNEWAYDQLVSIATLCNQICDKYHTLHFNTNHFNAY